MICEYCGKQFEGRKKKYCSRECCRSADRDNKRIKYVWKSARAPKCLLCGGELSQGQKKYCSQVCRRRYQSIYIEKSSFDHRELTKICIVCGKEFTTWKSRQFTCSTKCANRAHDSDRRIRGKVIDKDITLEKLAERDNNQCQICGLFVDWTDYEIRGRKKICGNFYPSKDHIIPLSCGGLHSWNNVQLAHRICNSRKQNKVI